MIPSRIIRPSRQDDLAAAQTLIAAVDLFPAGLLPGMAAPYLTGQADEHWLIAVGGGQALGLAYAAPERLTDGTCNLLLLAVHPDAQRSGLGRALVGAITSALSGAGGRLLLVETSGLAAFAGARAFYVRLGFGQEAVIRNYYQAGEDKVVFARPLKTGP
jgi:ribosomal protein S18 acetylase RimI-like enzyme